MTGFSPAICLVFYPQPHPLFFLLSEPPASVAKRGPVLTPVSSLEAFQFPVLELNWVSQQQSMCCGYWD